MKDRRVVLALGLFLTCLIGLVAIFVLSGKLYNLSNAPQPKAAPASANTAAVVDDGNPLTPPVSSVPAPAEEASVLAAGEIILRLLFAVILSGILAFRPRQNVPLFRRSLFVSQTQILLSVVAAALMLIVGDNTARAFAIFAAVSLVRFRTNIRDPKEITVLLISLALGLAAGVGRWELGIALCRSEEHT